MGSGLQGESLEQFSSEKFVSNVEFVLLIGTRNRLPLLRKCIDSVAKYMRDSWKIVVIDAGSTDGTIEYLKSFEDPRFLLVQDGKKMGQARSLNNVLRQIQCNFVGWISDDNTFTARGPLDAVETLSQDSRVGMVGMKVKDTSGAHMDAPYLGGIWPTGVLNINQGILRFDLFKKIGFFDETYGSYGIDSDLTTQVLLNGYWVVLTKDVTILHDRNHSDMPGAFTPQERTFEIERAREIYRDRYEKPLKFKVNSAYKRIVGYIWYRVNRSRTLEPYREAIIENFLGPRGLYMRDIYNVIFGRWISVFDLFFNSNKPIYLVQKIPLWWRIVFKIRSGNRVIG